MARIASIDGRGPALGATFALVILAGCSGEKRPAQAPPPPPAVAPGVALPPTPVRPEGADAVDAALTEAQLFNASATESLVDIAHGEARIRSLATRAVDLARRMESAAAAQRPDLSRTLSAALADREAAHAALGQSLEAFRTTSAATAALAEPAGVLCGPVQPAAPADAPPPTPGTLAAYPGCATLAVEQAKFTANITALSKAFESAEAAYRQDRPRIDEAAATMALVR